MLPFQGVKEGKGWRAFTQGVAIGLGIFCPFRAKKSKHKKVFSFLAVRSLSLFIFSTFFAKNFATFAIKFFFSSLICVNLQHLRNYFFLFVFICENLRENLFSSAFFDLKTGVYFVHPSAKVAKFFAKNAEKESSLDFYAK